MFGKMAAVFAFLKNKSLQASKPQLIGEKWLMACKVGGITYVGTHTPPRAASNTTETDPNANAWWCVLKNTVTNNP